MYLLTSWTFSLKLSSHAWVLIARIPDTSSFISEIRRSVTTAVSRRSWAQRAEMTTKQGSNSSRKRIPITGCQPIRYNSKHTTAASSSIDMKAVNIHLGANSILCTSFEMGWITLPVVVFRRFCWLISGICRQILGLVNITSLSKHSIMFWRLWCYQFMTASV